MSVIVLDPQGGSVELLNMETYYRSPQWLVSRERFRATEPWECLLCGSPHQIELHHRHYRTLGHETPEDLVALCRWHHYEIEKTVKRGVPRIDAHIAFTRPSGQLRRIDFEREIHHLTGPDRRQQTNQTEDHQ